MDILWPAEEWFWWQQATQTTSIIGAATGTDINPAPVSCEFFITNVNKDTKVDMMKQHIECNGITVRNLIIKEGNDYNIFVLKVSVEEVDKVWNQDIWPTGIYVRKCYPAKNK